MRKKKICAFVMALSFAATAITGCGGQASKPQNSSETTVTEATSENGETTEKTEEEDALIIPDINIEKEYSVPDTEAFKFVKDLKIGFSLGNTFDAFNDGGTMDEMEIESCWQGVKTTEKMIKDFHAAGFETVRIPISWHNHLSDDFTISEKWLNRVNEVVDWAINDGMYVIINIHHDNHKEADCFYPDKEHKEQSLHYIERIWEQLSERFKNYDNKLIFESMNEPRLVDTDVEWMMRPTDECNAAVAIINELNQKFVDTVRSSGGNNGERYLMVPGYDASPDGALNSGFVLPTDKEGVTDKILVSVHAYTPYDFALNIKGGSHFDETKDKYTKDIDSFMDRLYDKFIKEGVPVVIGEFGALSKKNSKKENNVQDRLNYSAYYIANARARGMSCLWWDNNAFTGDGENFGLYYRTGGYFIYQNIVDALMKYAD